MAETLRLNRDAGHPRPTPLCHHAKEMKTMDLAADTAIGRRRPIARSYRAHRAAILERNISCPAGGCGSRRSAAAQIAGAVRDRGRSALFGSSIFFAEYPREDIEICGITIDRAVFRADVEDAAPHARPLWPVGGFSSGPALHGRDEFDGSDFVEVACGDARSAHGFGDIIYTA